MNSIEIGAQIRSGQSVTTVPTVTDTVITLSAFQDDLTVLTGTASGAIVRTPDATSMPVGWTRRIKNISSEFVKIDNGAGGTLFDFIDPDMTVELTLKTASAAGTWSVSRSRIDLSKGFDNIDEFNSHQNNGELAWGTIAAGTGASMYKGNSTVRPATGSTSTGYCALVLISPTSFQNGTTNCATCTQFLIGCDTLSNGTETYITDAVMGNSGTATEHTSAIGFRYSSVVSANWQGLAVASSTPTVLDTGIAVTTTEQLLTCVVSSDTTRVDFWINRTYGGKIIAGVPTPKNFGAVIKIVKTAGSTQRYLEVDMYRNRAVYNGGRF